MESSGFHMKSIKSTNEIHTLKSGGFHEIHLKSVRTTDSSEILYFLLVFHMESSRFCMKSIKSTKEIHNEIHNVFHIEICVQISSGDFNVDYIMDFIVDFICKFYGFHMKSMIPYERPGESEECQVIWS